MTSYYGLHSHDVGGIDSIFIRPSPESFGIFVRSHSIQCMTLHPGSSYRSGSQNQELSIGVMDGFTESLNTSVVLN